MCVMKEDIQSCQQTTATTNNRQDTLGEYNRTHPVRIKIIEASGGFTNVHSNKENGNSGSSST